jgi:cell fate (sporulation/competence/biofilm development) regulator YmcA (YheA/YmcA/DUF963 family)
MPSNVLCFVQVSNPATSDRGIMKEIKELLGDFERDNIRLMQGSFDMDSVEKSRQAILQAFAEKDKRIAELERRLKIACHVKADDKVKFDWAVLDKIDELEENLKAAEAVINYYKNLMEASHD